MSNKVPINWSVSTAEIKLRKTDSFWPGVSVGLSAILLFALSGKLSSRLNDAGFSVHDRTIIISMMIPVLAFLGIRFYRDYQQTRALKYLLGNEGLDIIHEDNHVTHYQWGDFREYLINASDLKNHTSSPSAPDSNNPVEQLTTSSGLPATLTLVLNKPKFLGDSYIQLYLIQENELEAQQLVAVKIKKGKRNKYNISFQDYLILAVLVVVIISASVWLSFYFAK